MSLARNATVRLALTAVCFSLIACSRTSNVAPAPTTVAVPASTGAALAVIPVHVTYLLRALRPGLDSLFPTRDSLNAPQCSAVGGLLCHQYVYRRDSLSLIATAGQLEIATQLSYRAQLGMLGSTRLASCGYQPEAMRRAQLSMRTSLYWRRDWKIGARETQLAATLIDQCRVTLVGVNATRALGDVIDRQLREFAALADTTIPRVSDFKPLADSLWQSFLEPTALDTLGTLWLLLEPEGVQVTPLTGRGGRITTDLVLYAKPRIISGAKPSSRQRPLPALTLGVAPDQFTVPVSVELPFDDIAKRASVLLAAETASSSIRVDSVHVRGSGDSVRIDLDVSKGLRGRLTMMSRLRWDPLTRELRLDDLAWTLDSQGLLSGIKGTLGAPLIGRAVRRATMGGRIPLAAQLDSVRAEMMRKLNGPIAPGAVMGTSVASLQIESIGSSATAFVLRARLTGTSGVWIQ